MKFQLQSFDATSLAGEPRRGAFADVSIVEYNRLKSTGDGFLECYVGGQLLKKERSVTAVIAGFSGASFQEARRQYWTGVWSPSQESTQPDCSSEDGRTPNADAAHPQSAACATCPRSQKGADGYVDCGYAKDLLVYLTSVDAAGNAVIDVSTPLLLRLSAMSLFTKLDPASQSGGFNAIIGWLLKRDVRVVEKIAFEIGFHQSGKAPTFKIVGALPDDALDQVLLAASQPDVKALLLPRQAKTVAALPAPPKVAALPAPVKPPPTLKGVNLVPDATPAVVAAAAAPTLVVAVTPQAPAATLASVRAQVMAAMAGGDELPAALMAQYTALMAQAAPAAGPVAQAAPAAAQAAALSAFSLATPVR